MKIPYSGKNIAVREFITVKRSVPGVCCLYWLKKITKYAAHTMAKKIAVISAARSAILFSIHFNTIPKNILKNKQEIIQLREKR